MDLGYDPNPAQNELYSELPPISSTFQLPWQEQSAKVQRLQKHFGLPPQYFTSLTPQYLNGMWNKMIQNEEARKREEKQKREEEQKKEKEQQKENEEAREKEKEKKLREELLNKEKEKEKARQKGTAELLSVGVFHHSSEREVNAEDISTNHDAMEVFSLIENVIAKNLKEKDVPAIIFGASLLAFIRAKIISPKTKVFSLQFEGGASSVRYDFSIKKTVTKKKQRKDTTPVEGWLIQREPQITRSILTSSLWGHNGELARRRLDRLFNCDKEYPMEFKPSSLLEDDLDLVATMLYNTLEIEEKITEVRARQALALVALGYFFTNWAYHNAGEDEHDNHFKFMENAMKKFLETSNTKSRVFAKKRSLDLEPQETVHELLTKSNQKEWQKSLKQCLTISYKLVSLISLYGVVVLVNVVQLIKQGTLASLKYEEFNWMAENLITLGATDLGKFIISLHENNEAHVREYIVKLLKKMKVDIDYFQLYIPIIIQLRDESQKISDPQPEPRRTKADEPSDHRDMVEQYLLQYRQKFRSAFIKNKDKGKGKDKDKETSEGGVRTLSQAENSNSSQPTPPNVTTVQIHKQNTAIPTFQSVTLEHLLANAEGTLTTLEEQYSELFATTYDRFIEKRKITNGEPIQQWLEWRWNPTDEQRQHVLDTEKWLGNLDAGETACLNEMQLRLDILQRKREEIDGYNAQIALRESPDAMEED